MEMVSTKKKSKTLKTSNDTQKSPIPIQELSDLN